MNHFDYGRYYGYLLQLTVALDRAHAITGLGQAADAERQSAISSSPWQLTKSLIHRHSVVRDQEVRSSNFRAPANSDRSLLIHFASSWQQHPASQAQMRHDGGFI